MKKLFIAILGISSLSAMQLVKNTSSAVALKLYSNNRQAYVEDENAAYQVERYNMNPLMREVLNRQALGKFKDAGYIRINKLDEGKYELLAKVRGEGGGIWGAHLGFLAGKFAVHFVAQTGIALATAGVAIVCPPAAAPFFYAAEATLTPTIEATSNVIALGTGLLGAAVTGPV